MKKNEIVAEITITDGSGFTRVIGNNIEEVIEKIKETHTMNDFIREHLEKKGKLKIALKSGWYLKPRQ